MVSTSKMAGLSPGTVGSKGHDEYQDGRIAPKKVKVSITITHHLLLLYDSA